MFISDFAIQRPIVTVTTMLALVVFGLLALGNLNTDEFPEITPPIIGLTILYPGASPEMVEREIVDRVEDAVFSITGVDTSKSTATATDGLANFVIWFEFSKDVNQASQDVRDAISGIRQDLPLEMEEPVVTRFDPADLPIVSLALTSETLEPSQLTRLADPDIVSALRGIPGVAQATVVGGVKAELTVQLQPPAMEAAGIGVGDVVRALSTQNLAAPVGRLNTELQERAIRLTGRLETPEQFEDLVVTDRGGDVIRLGQVAHAFAGSEEPRTLALYEGKQAVGIDILKTSGYSTTSVADRILARVQDIQKTLPEGAQLRVVVNAGERVTRSVREVEEALFEGALLTVLVVFLFLNSWRSTVITGLALPVSVLASFISVWAFGFTLNTMSLLGLSLAIGILIDDAIVVRENIVRHVEMGKDHYTASREGTDEIGLAVAATTFSIVAVFVPIAFISGLAGQWMKPFALTMACAVLVSLFVSFSLDPMLSAYWADPQLEEGQRRGFVSRQLTRFNGWFDRQADRYERVVGWALDHRFAMVALATASFLGALFLQGAFGGAGFAPVSDRSEINLIVETPPGSSLEYTRRKVEQVHELVRRHPEVRYTYAALGTPLELRSPGVDQALVYVRLIPRADRKLNQEQFGAVLREELQSVGGADVSVFTSGFGGAQSQIQVQVKGPDLDRLNDLAEAVKAQAQQVPGAADVSLSTRGRRPEVQLDLQRGLAGSLGITTADVAQALRPAFAGIDAGDWIDPSGETRDVQVRLAPEARERPADLERLPIPVPNRTGGPPQLVPLGQIARVTEGEAPAQIQHLGRDRVITVGANSQGRPLSDVVQEITTRLGNVPLPTGYSISQGGEAQDQNEVFGKIFTALGAAVMLMYLILVIQFGSFVDPLAILLSLPLSLIGVVLALLITGDTLNIMSLIGVMLLMGIVAKNAILLIDFAKWDREKNGTTLRDALVRAGRIRLRPIVMTTLALIAGMLPIALGLGEGGDFRAPLGRAVIGGVITSTLLTLLVIPTAYEILDAIRERFFRLGRRLMGKPPARHDATHERA